MYKIILIKLFLVLTLNAQTMAYKCTDVDDSKYWNYFNIDYNSLHFKEGKYTNTLYFKDSYKNNDVKTFIFKNDRIKFTVKQRRNNFKNLLISDGRYSYNCILETILKDGTNKTPIILK